jgi:hypothetical protein
MALSSSAVNVQASATYTSMSECTPAAAGGSASASLNRSPSRVAGGRGSSSATSRRTARVSWAEVQSSQHDATAPDAWEPQTPPSCASQLGPVPWLAGSARRALRTWTGGCKTGHSDGVHLSTGGGVAVTCVEPRGHSASVAAGHRDTSGSALAPGRVPLQTGSTLHTLPPDTLPCTHALGRAGTALRRTDPATRFVSCVCRYCPRTWGLLSNRVARRHGS